MEFKEGKVGRIAHAVGKILPESSFKRTLWHYYNRHIKFRNTFKAVEGIIDCKEFQDRLLHIWLRNGLEYVTPRKLGSKYMVYREAYELLMEQFVEGIYERNYRLQNGDIIIDIGASLGFNTVDFSKKVGNEGKVIAIEPDEENLAILQKNLELNGCENVTIVKKGVWSKKDKLHLQVKERGGGNSLVIAEGKIIGTVEIEVDTLDNILEQLGIKKVNLVKMDVEGAEIEAVKGMRKILSKNGTRVVIASYHIVDGQPTYKTIIPTMEAMGFSTKFDSRNGIAYFEKITPVVGQALGNKKTPA